MKLRRALTAAAIAIAVGVGSVSFAGKPAKKATAAPAASKETADVVKKLQARYDATADFTADFKQVVEVATLGQKLESSGKVYFKRPGRMRWEFLKPDPQTIVADGTTLWVHQPEHHQVLKAPFRAMFQSATPLSFLFGVGKLTQDFNASLVPSDDTAVAKLKLLPKQDREIGVLVLAVDRRSYDIVAADVTDPLGNVTHLEFQNMQRGVGLDDAKFKFTAPPGTDVVEPPSNQ